MLRRSTSSFLPLALVILSTALASAQQASPSNPPPHSLSPVLTNAAPIPTNSTTTPAASSAVAPVGMQAPVLPTPETERSSFSSIRVDGPYIAMTFDDGPDAKLTPRLLDILKERHIHVTFFVLGERA